MNLKPKTQDLKPINQSFVSSIKPWFAKALLAQYR